MKTHIFNMTDKFPDKVNFVDTNNVLLGYDLQQNCCENAFWTISESKDGGNPIHQGGNDSEKEITLDGYGFDPEFYEREDSDGEESYVAIFKLRFHSWTEPQKPDLFIRLENRHNGYYSHGFTFKGAKTIQESL